MRRFGENAALCATLLLAQPAFPQHLDEHWAYCNDQDRRFPVDVVIRGCTAIIESAATNRRSLTFAYTSRGNAYLRAGATGSAMSDFQRAIEINTQLAGVGSRASDKGQIAGADPPMFDLKRLTQLNRKQIAAYYLKRGRKLMQPSGSGLEAAGPADSKVSH